LLSDKKELTKILDEGREKAREIASNNLNEIKRLVGMLV
jgi:hypothetical protein